MSTRIKVTTRRGLVVEADIEIDQMGRFLIAIAAADAEPLSPLSVTRVAPAKMAGLEAMRHFHLRKSTQTSDSSDSSDDDYESDVSESVDKSVAIRFLEKLREVGSLTQSEVMTLLGASHPKGIGSKLGGINRLLAAAGLTAAEVYSKNRNGDGARIWMPKERLDDALLALKGTASENR